MKIVVVSPFPHPDTGEMLERGHVLDGAAAQAVHDGDAMFDFAVIARDDVPSFPAVCEPEAHVAPFVMPAAKYLTDTSSALAAKE